MQDYEKNLIKKIYKISQLYKNGTQEQRLQVGKIMTENRKTKKK